MTSIRAAAASAAVALRVGHAPPAVVAGADLPVPRRDAGPVVRPRSVGPARFGSGCSGCVPGGGCSRCSSGRPGSGSRSGSRSCPRSEAGRRGARLCPRGGPRFCPCGDSCPCCSTRSQTCSRGRGRSCSGADGRGCGLASSCSGAAHRSGRSHRAHRAHGADCSDCAHGSEGEPPGPGADAARDRAQRLEAGRPRAPVRRGAQPALRAVDSAAGRRRAWHLPGYTRRALPT